MKNYLIVLALALTVSCNQVVSPKRLIEKFNSDWRFSLVDNSLASNPDYNDSEWRTLNLPHDWSIEGEFSEQNPATPGGGALPGGIGWYRKTFTLPVTDSMNQFFIHFDGVYRNSEVFINGHSLGKRPNGYISFEYNLTPFLRFGNTANVLAVRVDNSEQPNSRWYSGSGIYRNVYLIKTSDTYVGLWGTFITTPKVTSNEAEIRIQTRINNSSVNEEAPEITTLIFDKNNHMVAKGTVNLVVEKDGSGIVDQTLTLKNPILWSVEKPDLYKATTVVRVNGKVVDNYDTPFGIRYFNFDVDKGFSLNGQPMKILGVCNHHDLGCLGAAVNKRAIERQLEILKGMGCNAIRTSHNPPAPELLDLCDQMGFLVMDEAFDMWKKPKTNYDYSKDWDAWHEIDLRDQLLRDRNHPSVIIWSIGNEIIEQWDSTGTVIAPQLSEIVHRYDTTRPITSACNEVNAWNNIIKSGALDLIGLNYHHEMYDSFPQIYPGKKFIATETTSALETRGSYDMPSDSIRRWPVRWDLPLLTGNADNSCSAYDNCSAPWGSTHEETWKIIKKYDFLSGMFIWTGFDYLGEPTPYSWPSRSSYFGIIDLAGFPKDVYYMYQSEWTNKPVLHLFPHWNWKTGNSIDVWAYTNCTSVELFLNGKSLGVKSKTSDDLHLSWHVAYQSGTLKAFGTTADGHQMEAIVKTASAPAQLVLTADRSILKPDGTDLSFVTVSVVDADGTEVPYADNLIDFELKGDMKIVGVDNGSEVSHEPFKANYRKAFHGKCLVVIQSSENAGQSVLIARSDGLKSAELNITAKN